jgi:hypothetical protein
MENETEDYRKIMNHGYWTEMLALPKGGGINSYVEKAAKRDRNGRRDFISKVTKGFYPISCSSPIAFNRVAKLSDEPETVKPAKLIYEVELGLHPVMKNHPYTGVPHSEQFRRSMESLVEGVVIPYPEFERDQLMGELELHQSGLTQALATCDVIEHIAPEVIQYFREFIGQWQVATGRKSKDMDTTFFDEHALLEDDKCEDQHIGLIDAMLKPYSEQASSVEYANWKRKYHEKVILHLNRVSKGVSDIQV